MATRRVLVVGTTSDYVHLLNQRHPARTLFLTSAAERAKAHEAPPEQSSEVLSDLTRPQQSLARLQQHLKQWKIELSGIMAFDCESMPLAARIARKLSLCYPSPESIAACRSKFLSKQLWQRANLPCPQVALVSCAAEAARFLRRLGRPAVLKPLTGSGSELLFLCTRPRDCEEAVRTLQERLAHHPDLRMYAPSVADGAAIDPRRVFAMEELVRGTEYSCDFLVDGESVQVVRIARKIPAPALPFGTTLAYVLPAELPAPLSAAAFAEQLRGAADALGLTRAMCMLDFIVREGRPVMLELAPRPGGDCLPWLIRRSSGLDILGSALDYAERRSVRVPPPPQWRPLVGLRLFANRAGTVRQVDDKALRADPRVLECYFKHGPGHAVVLPPEDYDSRLLGHVIFDPSISADIERDCSELLEKFHVEIEPA